MPPLTATAAEPVLPPLHLTLTCEGIAASVEGVVTVALVVVEHPFASVMVQV